jgi:hypothetical protein
MQPNGSLLLFGYSTRKAGAGQTAVLYRVLGSNVGCSMRGAARAMTAEYSHYETNLPDWADAVDEQADAEKN